MCENESYSRGSIRTKSIISDSPGRSNIGRQKEHKEIKVQIKQAQGTLAASVCSAFLACLVLDIHAQCTLRELSLLKYTFHPRNSGDRGLWALLQCLNGQNIQIPFVSLQQKHTFLESTAAISRLYHGGVHWTTNWLTCLTGWPWTSLFPSQAS